MSRSTDVVVIGGGAIGGAVATAVLEDPAFAGRVTVIERDPTFRRASSALSAASIRQQFSTPENIRMSRYSFGWLREAGVGLHESGYLFLATAVGASVLEDNVTVQRAEGADVELLSVPELGPRFPWLALDGVALASLGRGGEGWFDGYALVRVLRTRARELGADLVTGEVVDLEVVGDRVATVILADGRRIEPDVVVDAAGPWARDVAVMAGVDLPVEARRRSVFVFDVASDPPIDCPLVIDTSGAWFRPEGESFIAGIAPPQADDLADLPLEVDRDQFERQLWPALAARVPAFDAIKVTNAWAGYYEVNTFDHNAIIGPHPRIANLLFANGFSGHGIQQAPAVGRALAELIVHGGYRTLDLSIFGFDRIAAGRPVLERNVIG
ncbi:MAG TPA: FAD-binding oxidoreductase [Candidatus Limnocylindrales bacterium]|jgi:FAD-dependent oxidoreductase domain-containing protein 1|nr:FAD-binding oxidoreductase [Candidatus Limnocylindrales bacterium]